jgi:HEAT repeat protein
MVLRAMADQPAVRPTLVALVGEGNAPQRKMALYCLRDLGTGDAEELAAARRALGDREPGVRLAAIAMLAARAPRAAAADVAACVRDADPGVRRAAAATLGALGVRDAVIVDALTAASRSDDASLARAAAGALRRLAELTGQGPGMQPGPPRLSSPRRRGPPPAPSRSSARPRRGARRCGTVRRRCCRPR